MPPLPLLLRLRGGSSSGAGAVLHASRRRLCLAPSSSSSPTPSTTTTTTATATTRSFSSAHPPSLAAADHGAHDAHDAHGAHESKYDAPGGWLFGIKPGEKYQKEGWEGIMFWGFGGAMVLMVVGWAFKPDTSIQTWALEEARRRLEVEGILPEPDSKP